MTVVVEAGQFDGVVGVPQGGELLVVSASLLEDGDLRVVVAADGHASCVKHSVQVDGADVAHRDGRVPSSRIEGVVNRDCDVVVLSCGLHLSGASVLGHDHPIRSPLMKVSKSQCLRI